MSADCVSAAAARAVSVCWVESEFIFFQSCAARGAKREVMSFNNTTQFMLKKAVLTGLGTNEPPSSAAAQGWPDLAMGEPGRVAMATSWPRKGLVLAEAWSGWLQAGLCPPGAGLKEPRGAAGDPY